MRASSIFFYVGDTIESFMLYFPKNARKNPWLLLELARVSLKFEKF